MGKNQSKERQSRATSATVSPHPEGEGGAGQSPAATPPTRTSAANPGTKCTRNSKEEVQCLLWKKGNKNTGNCGMCHFKILDNNRRKLDEEAKGEYCLRPTSKLDDITSKLPFCAKCEYTFFCNYCHDILRRIECERMKKCKKNEFEKSGNRAQLRHPYCPKCCPKARNFCKIPLTELMKKLNVNRKFDADSWDLCTVDDEDYFDDRMSTASSVSSSTVLKLFDASELVRAVERDPKNPLRWFELAASIFPTQTIEVQGEGKIDKLDCLGKAIGLDPNNAEYLMEILLHMPKARVLVVNGHERSVLDFAVRCVELAPESSAAWRNLGFFMSCKDSLEVAGFKNIRRPCALRNACRFSMHENEYFAAAYAMGADPSPLWYKGGDISRHDLLLQLLNSIPEHVTLRDAAKAIMSEFFALSVVCELALLFPDHPKVVELRELFHVVEDKMLGSGAYGQVFEAYYQEGPTFPKQKLAAKKVKYSESLVSITKEPEMNLMTCHRFQEYITRCHFIQFDPIKREATMFLEFATYGSLHHLVAGCGHRLHELNVRGTMQQVTEALSHMHAYNVVHQDIKPQNILVFDDKKVKLADFGVSCTLSCPSSVVVGGTHTYMPPEALLEEVVSTAGDIWAMGVTLVEIASGTNAIPDPEHVESGAEPPYKPYIPNHLSPKLRELLARCFDTNYKTRITAKELLADPYYDDMTFEENYAHTLESEQDFEENKGGYGIPEEVLTGSVYSNQSTMQLGLTATATTMRRGE